MRKVLFLSLLLIAVTGLVAMPASADDIQYTFSWSGGDLGSISMIPGGLQGSGIGLDNLEVYDVTTNTDTNYAITSGSLDFNTVTGAISISGNAGAFGSGVLLSGSMTGTPNGCGSSDLWCDWNFNLSSNLGGGVGFANSDLQLGVAGGPWTTNSQLVMTELIAAPEPASLPLLASGLALVAGTLRRKLVRR